jgi:hypothetical protein
MARKGLLYELLTIFIAGYEWLHIFGQYNSYGVDHFGKQIWVVGQRAKTGSCVKSKGNAICKH